MCREIDELLFRSKSVHEPSACGRFPQYQLKLKHELPGALSGVVLRLQGSGNVTKFFFFFL